MTLWFGASAWPRDDHRAPICQSDDDRIPVPIDAVCVMCDELIDEHDQGVAIPSLVLDAQGEPTDGGMTYNHRECMLRSVVGCYGSVTGHGHSHDVPYRQDARQVQVWLDQGH